MEQILPWQNMVKSSSRFTPRLVMPATLSAGNHATHSLHAALVQPERWRDGRCFLCNASMRLFARLSLDSALPDRTTIMNFRHLLGSINWPANCSKINRWLAEAGVMMTQGTWWMPPSLRHPARPRTRAATRSGDASDQERQSVALWHAIGVDAKSG